MFLVYDGVNPMIHHGIKKSGPNLLKNICATNSLT